MSHSLYVLTAVTRPHGISFIAAGLASIVSAGHQVTWLIAPGQQNDPGGQRSKNALIEQVPPDAWLWICDDDTVPHPELLSTLRSVWAERPDAEMIVVSQRRSGVPPDDSPSVLIASPDAMHPGQVDIGQLVIRRRAMQEMVLVEAYDADGQLAEQLAARLGDRAVYVDTIASLHNWTRVLCNHT